MNYQTRDMGLAVAMITLGHKLIELHASKDKRYFTFELDVERWKGENIATEYTNGEVKVDAKAYWNNVRDIKTKLYEAKKGQ